MQVASEHLCLVTFDAKRRTRPAMCSGSLFARGEGAGRKMVSTSSTADSLGGLNQGLRLRLRPSLRFRPAAAAPMLRKGAMCALCGEKIQSSSYTFLEGFVSFTAKPLTACKHAHYILCPRHCPHACLHTNLGNVQWGLPHVCTTAVDLFRGRALGAGMCQLPGPQQQRSATPAHALLTCHVVLHTLCSAGLLPAGHPRHAVLQGGLHAGGAALRLAAAGHCGRHPGEGSWCRG